MGQFNLCSSFIKSHESAKGFAGFSKSDVLLNLRAGTFFGFMQSYVRETQSIRILLTCDGLEIVL